MDVFERRVHPLVRGFREIRALNHSVTWRNEWLKYSAIGYIACVEGYIRLLISDLINQGDPYLTRIRDLRDIKFTADTVIAIQKKKVTLGEFVAHLLPLNGFEDINSHLSALIGSDYKTLYLSKPCSKFNPKPVGDVFPEHIGRLSRLFELRHLYAHELATKKKVPVREIEDLVGSAAMFVTMTEELMNEQFFG